MCSGKQLFSRHNIIITDESTVGDVWIESRTFNIRVLPAGWDFVSYLTSLKKVCTFILPYSDSLSNSTSSFLLCPWSCLSHLHPLFSLNLTSYDPLQFFPFLFPSFSPPLLNPPDSHCNLVINVFSDKKKKKKTQPLLFPAFISLSPLCLIAVENQNTVPMTAASTESKLIALSVDTRGPSGGFVYLWPHFARTNGVFQAFFARRVLIRVISDRMLKLGVLS